MPKRTLNLSFSRKKKTTFYEPPLLAVLAEKPRHELATLVGARIHK
jgi:hypothetical protein